jgi:hypothetical protein
MPVTNVTEDYEVLGASDEVSEDGRTWSGVIPRAFDVTFDEADFAYQRPLLALLHPDVPQKLQPHPSEPFAWVKSRLVKVHSGPLMFKVNVNYQYNPNPLAVLPEWDYTFAREQGEFEYDKGEKNDAGAYTREPKRVANSAHEPFDPLPTTEYIDLVLQITRHQSTYDAQAAADSWINHTSSKTWLLWGIGMVKMSDFTGKKIYDPSAFDRFGNRLGYYYRVNYEFQMRTKNSDPKNVGWLRCILDQGRREFTGLDKSGKPIYKPILDKEGNPVIEPVLLNKAGRILASPETAAAPFLEFKGFESVDFNLLGDILLPEVI